MEGKHQKISDEIRKHVCDYIQRESNYNSLITVTNVLVSKDFNKATFFVTVLPENQEVAALDFLKRQRRYVKAHIKKNSRLSRLPQIDFELDKGEKARQTIEEISLNLD